MKMRVLLGCLLLPLCLSAAQKPNVLLIVCDDLNDYITSVADSVGHPQAKTPHVERFAETAVSFRRAYSNNPVCAPSRSSFLTGSYGHTTGNLFWKKRYENPILKHTKSITPHFRDNGYYTVGTGCPLQPGAMRGNNRPEGDSLPARQERSVKAAGLKKRIPSRNSNP